MDQTIKCLLLKSDIILITEIVEVGSELGEPDCKLINPFKVVKQDMDTEDLYGLETWLDFTNQNEVMIHSDSILTIVDPTSDLLSKYFDLLK